MNDQERKDANDLSGYSITKDIAESGGNVAVLDLRSEPLEDVYGLAKEFGVKAEYFQADVSNEQSLSAAFEKAVQSLGKIDGIVTAAGIVRTWFIYRSLFNEWDQTWYAYPLWIAAAVEIDLGVVSTLDQIFVQS